MEEKNIVNFDGSDYVGSAYITSKGDTVRSFHPVGGLVPKGHIYRLEYRTKKGETEPLLITTQETGGTWDTDPVRINHTSDWGKTLDDAFLLPSRSIPITTDVSKMPRWKRWFYSIKYNQNGGLLQNFTDNAPDSKKEEQNINYSELFRK